MQNKAHKRENQLKQAIKNKPKSLSYQREIPIGLWIRAIVVVVINNYPIGEANYKNYRHPEPTCQS